MSYLNEEMERRIQEELRRRQVLQDPSLQGQQAGAVAYLRQPDYSQLGISVQAPSTHDYYARALQEQYQQYASNPYSALANAQQQLAQRSYVDQDAYTRQLYQETLIRQAQQQQANQNFVDPRMLYLQQLQGFQGGVDPQHDPSSPAALQSPEASQEQFSSPDEKSRPKTKIDSLALLKKMDMPKRRIEGNKLIEEDTGEEYFIGERALGLEDDKFWLTDLQVYLRNNFAEAFSATEDDIAAPMHGRNKPIALGQVGIRCIHCKNEFPMERGQQATSYPSMISGIYNSVQQMLRLHLDCCLSMPTEVKEKIEQLKEQSSSRGGRKQYWIDSAKRIGLEDTKNGIHFVRDPNGPLPALSGPSVTSREGKRKKMIAKYGTKVENGKAIKEAEKKPSTPRPVPPPVDARPLVFPEDRELISDYLYLTLEQMAPCKLSEVDQVGCYKTRDIGSPGLACRHCVGQAGSGRYFPASEASLSQTTTSQTIMNHVRNCRRCPLEIREQLELMKRSKAGQDRKTSSKPRHGGRKVFFHRLFCRISDLPINEGDIHLPPPKVHRTPGSTGKRRRRRSDLDEFDEDDYTDEEEEEEEEARPRKSSRKTKIESNPWFHGCVHLKKADDRHWLSELECFAREDLVELFTFTERDSLAGYVGERQPAPGQIGLRCMFCKELDPADRTNGSVTFPMTTSHLQAKMTEMLRVHFSNCSSIPKAMRRKFDSLNSSDSKVDAEDSQQYWVDSAKDLGVTNISPDHFGWGMTFRRDPGKPSPTDELDEDNPGFWKAESLVESSDRGLCTDYALLLLNQYRPCRYKDIDKRAGPGSGGREREVGFPGLACIHCSGTNTVGRFFPTTPKRLVEHFSSNLPNHLSSCIKCPEEIKASLSYLNHRSILQRAELSGSWKKQYFDTIWQRLHQSNFGAEETEEGLDEANGGTANGGSYMSDEEVDNVEQSSRSMEALIKAATLWLEEQDGMQSEEVRRSRSTASSSKKKRPKGRS